MKRICDWTYIREFTHNAALAKSERDSGNGPEARCTVWPEPNPQFEITMERNMRRGLSWGLPMKLRNSANPHPIGPKNADLGLELKA